jgi:putative alpha-1,2-mannosidase
LENGKQFKIQVKNQSAKNTYVQAVYLNGVKINGHQLLHQEVMSGGELTFLMGDKIPTH